MKPSKRTLRREKKKNEEIQRSLDISFGNMKISATHDVVPHDLIPEILSRLPAKSIVRFRAVCKFWYSITTTPDFINSFSSRSRSSPSVLLTFQSNKTREVNKGLTFSYNSNAQCQLVFSFPQDQNHHPHGSYDVYQMANTPEYLKPPRFPQFGRFESVHGLVILPGFVIWNPTMRQFFTLPKPTGSRGRTYLGYDPIEGKHKAVHISEKPQVLTLGVQESWRAITKGSLPTHPDPYGDYIDYSHEINRGRCFHGTLYFDIDDQQCVMSFDVRFEKFNSPIHYPEDGYIVQEYYTNRIPEKPLMIPYEGTLALVTKYLQYGDVVDLCILEDVDGAQMDA